MRLILLNILVALGVTALILILWCAVAIVSYKRSGGRKVGCSGPTVDKRGVAVCCKGDKVCDEAETHMNLLGKQ
mgnify:FL=1